MANNKKNNIRKYRRPINLNPGMLIFAGIFLYVLICIFIYMNTKHIIRYQVIEGTLTSDNIYTGIAFRNETVYNSNAAGYINFYAREGARVAVGDMVYTLDETGKLSDYLESLNEGENTLSNAELNEFRSDIISFSHSFNTKHFDTVYDFNYNIKNSVLKMANTNMLSNIDDINSTTGNNGVNFNYSTQSGIVSYWIDGFESIIPEQLTKDMFDEKNYTKNMQEANSLVSAADPVFKISSSENWDIVIPIDKERGEELVQEGYIKVRFIKNQYEAWAQVSMFTGADGDSYLKLSFTNSMISFVSDRFIQLELIIEDEIGLKIPNSAIVSKEFYLIPQDFVIQSDKEDNSITVAKKTYNENGEFGFESISVEAYSFDEETGEYYISSDNFQTGDVLNKEDMQEQYTISKRATLIGVYNMNKGYADFKQICILSQNDEYAIVKPNTMYGLNVYDYIVLDANSVMDDEFIKY